MPTTGNNGTGLTINNKYTTAHPKTIEEYKILLAERDKEIGKRDREIEKLHAERVKEIENLNQEIRKLRDELASERKINGKKYSVEKEVNRAETKETKEVSLSKPTSASSESPLSKPAPENALEAVPEAVPEPEAPSGSSYQQRRANAWIQATAASAAAQVADAQAQQNQQPDAPVIPAAQSALYEQVHHHQQQLHHHQQQQHLEELAQQQHLQQQLYESSATENELADLTLRLQRSTEPAAAEAANDSSSITREREQQQQQGGRSYDASQSATASSPVEDERRRARPSDKKDAIAVELLVNENGAAEQKEGPSLESSASASPSFKPASVDASESASELKNDVSVLKVAKASSTVQGGGTSARTPDKKDGRALEVRDNENCSVGQKEGASLKSSASSSSLPHAPAKAAFKSASALISDVAKLGKASSPAQVTKESARPSGKKDDTVVEGLDNEKCGVEQKQGASSSSKNKKQRKPQNLDTEKMKQYFFQLEEKWNVKFQELKEYRKKFGNCNVPFRYKYNPPLGIWVSKQREHYRSVLKQKSSSSATATAKPRISDERIAQLNTLGFTWNAPEQNHGGVKGNVPTELRHETKSGSASSSSKPASGIVSEAAPAPKFRGGSEQMQEYIAKMQEKWDAKLEELKEYKLSHGDCLVPNKYPDNQPLSSWVRKQREYYRLMLKQKCSPEASTANRRHISDDRVAQLNRIGFCWKVPAPTSTPGEGRKKRKKDDTGENDMEDENGEAESNNKKRKPNEESEKMKQYLAKIEEKWNAKLQELAVFKSIHGNTNVPLRYKDNPSLGGWVRNQRDNYRALLKQKASPEAATTKPKISDERIAKLNELGFNWDVTERKDGCTIGISSTDQYWDDRMQELKDFKIANGHCVVPTVSALGKFVRRVRHTAKLINYKHDEVNGNSKDETNNESMEEEVSNDNNNNNATSSSSSRLESSSTSNDCNEDASRSRYFQWLTPDRINQLNEIGFVWSPTETWEENYLKLRAYRFQHGNCRVSKAYDRKLNLWVLTQRQIYKNTMDEEKANDPKIKTMSAEKIIKLQRLGFEWETQEKDYADAWEARFRDLITFKAQHGHTLVPRRYKQNMKLTHWVQNQRRYKKNLKAGKGLGLGVLTEDRIRRLEEIGFEWSSKNSTVGQQRGQHDDASSEEEMEPVQPRGNPEYSFAYPLHQSRHNRYY